MGTPTVQSLLGAVRRRMWRGHFIAAARWACWGSAALLLFAAALHASARPVRIDEVVASIAVLWASAILWAALRRPSMAASALWADRLLGGASAYSTLLELRNASQPEPRAEAVRWLEQWANASVPQARRLLAARRDRVRLFRPLLCLCVCAAFAALVLTLPGLVPAERPQIAASPTLAAEHATPADAAPLASAGVASELASALRSADSRNTREGQGGGATPGGAAAKSDEPRTSTIGDRSGVATPGASGAATQSPAGDAVDARHTAARGTGVGSGTGREAGSSRDDRADAAVSPALPGSLSVRQRESRTLHPMAETRADMDQPATFDDEPASRAAAQNTTPLAAAAAAAPPAAQATRLTPAQGAYVQAWMKTNAKR